MTDKELYDLCHEYLEYRDGKLYWKKFSSSRAKVGQEAGYLEEVGYIKLRLGGKDYRAHRLIFLMHHGHLPKFLDHINRDRSDNRIENLRQASVKDNVRNKTIQKNNSTGFKGIWFNQRLGKYQAELKVDGIKKYLGVFADPEEAHKAYVKAAKKYFGEFACTG